MKEFPLTRRNFLKTVAVAVPATAVLLETARADGLPHLDPNDPTAKALYYVDNSAKVDKANPLAARWTAEQKCSTCAQVQGKDGDAWRPCGIFPGKLVNANGWCSVWAKKG